MVGRKCKGFETTSIVWQAQHKARANYTMRSRSEFATPCGRKRRPPRRPDIGGSKQMLYSNPLAPPDIHADPWEKLFRNHPASLSAVRWSCIQPLSASHFDGPSSTGHPESLRPCGLPRTGFPPVPRLTGAYMTWTSAWQGATPKIRAVFRIHGACLVVAEGRSTWGQASGKPEAPSLSAVVQ